MTSSPSLDVELLLDRLLSASNPSDCLDSLEQLQRQCTRRRRKANQSQQQQQQQQQQSQEEQEEAAEDERQSQAIDTLLGNPSALRALCSLIAQSILPSQQQQQQYQDGGGGVGDGSLSGMEVEGGDVAACELLLAVVPSSPPSTASTASSSSSSGHNGHTASIITTSALQKQRQSKRRLEFISKTLLHFHESTNDNNSSNNSIINHSTNTNDGGLIPSLLDCLCSTSSTSSGTSTIIPQPSTYARVLSLQILSSLLTASPGTLREQLMKAPEGINRLVDLLGHASDGGGGGTSLGESSVPEEVRNEAILFLTSLASSSSMLARLITFSEGYDRALKIALESTGETITTTTAMDCLELCLSLANADDVARELFLGGGDGRGNLNRLALLMDLRGGERFRLEEKNVWWEEEMGKRRRMRLEEERRRRQQSVLGVGNGRVGGEEKQREDGKSGGKSGKRGKQSKKDDLDDILQGAATSGTASSSAKSSSKSKGDSTSQSNIPLEPVGPPTPYLTPNESSIVTSVLHLLLVLLYDGDYNQLDMSQQQSRQPTDASRAKRRARAKTIVSHDLLSRSIVDCALYSPPPPGMAFVSAAPTPELQQKALVTMAVLGSMGDTTTTVAIVSREDENDDGSDSKKEALRKKEMEETSKIQTHLLFETMPLNLGPVAAMDRLMFLAATGAYRPQNHSSDMDCYDEESAEAIASLLSINAISTLRACLPSETASRMVLHALAPPPPDEADAMGGPLEEPHVSRMVTTLVSNLRFLQSQQKYFQHLNEDPQELQNNDRADLDRMISIHQATIFAAGSAATLGVFITKGEGDAIREMLLRLVPPPPPPPISETDESGNVASYTTEATSNNLIDFILQHVATYDPQIESESFSPSSTTFHASSSYVTLELLRLLSEWVEGMPKAVSEVLTSPSSVCLGVLLRSNPSKGTAKSNQKESLVTIPSGSEAIPAMSGLLLGLCLEYMMDNTTDSNNSDSPNMENAAWTPETIMNMIQSMGVGKYLNLIDAWRKRPLPLPYCLAEQGSNMEMRSFSSWYSNSVTLIRRRMVLTLAGSGGEDECDSDGEGEGGTTDGKSSRSLRRMVTSQAKELEELQMKLEESLRTIANQSTQVTLLKRLSELGTSAETNDMLSEYAEKVSELEKEKGNLIVELQKQSESQKEAVAVKEEEIGKIQENLLQTQKQVEELEREKETLHDEMAGLSAAYNSLEQEYNNNNGVNSSAHTEMTAGGETAAEDGGTRDHFAASAHGEAAAEDPGRSDSHNHQLQSLRDENARLREDVRAANEWMSMAVSKMEEMGGENESLARSLEEAQARSDSGSNAGAAMSGELDYLRNEIQRILGESEAARISFETEMKAKGDEISQQRDLVQELESRVQQTNQSSTEVTSAASSQVEELASLRKANKDAEEWIASAVTHVDTLTKEITELKEKNDELQKANALSADSTSRESEAKVSELELSIVSITSERNALQDSLSQTKAEIAELQTENKDQLETIESLQSLGAGKEALEAEIDNVTAQNISLTAERDSLQSNLTEFQSWSETAQARMAEIESELEHVTLEKNRLEQKCNNSENAGNSEQLETLQAEVSKKDEEISDLRDQLDRVQNQLIEDAETNDAETEKLRSDIETEKKRYEDLRDKEAESSALLIKLSAEKDDLASFLTKAQAEIDSLKAAEIEYNARIKDANCRNTELEAARSAAEAQVEQLMKLDNGNTEDQIIAITAERNEIKSVSSCNALKR